MQVAIIGSGFAGATLSFLLSEQGAEVTVFRCTDGASMASAGLLHPYPGKRARKHPLADEGMAATKRLLEIAGSDTYDQSGLLRLPNANQVDDFKQALQYPDTEWREGLFIKSAITVRPDLYIPALLQKSRCQLIDRQVESLQELAAYDQIYIAAGCGSAQFCNEVIRPVKGQALKLQWPPDIPPLPYPIMQDKYLVMSDDNTSVVIGATFERRFTTPLPDIETAKELLLPKAFELVPELKEMPILDCRAGLRATTPTHQPIAKQLDDKTFLLTGLGSKGLLVVSHLASTQKWAK